MEDLEKGKSRAKMMLKNQEPDKWLCEGMGASKNGFLFFGGKKERKELREKKPVV